MRSSSASFINNKLTKKVHCLIFGYLCLCFEAISLSCLNFLLGIWFCPKVSDFDCHYWDGSKVALLIFCCPLRLWLSLKVPISSSCATPGFSTGSSVFFWNSQSACPFGQRHWVLPAIPPPASGCVFLHLRWVQEESMRCRAYFRFLLFQSLPFFSWAIPQPSLPYCS